ncbi:MAG: hypothetical protein K9I85_13910 [Saprospiraceae bacterium]|nr:hypothetical protein [Saprospiraceae bacterium]
MKYPQTIPGKFWIILTILFGQISLFGQVCDCPNGNNPSGPIITAPSETPVVSCFEDLEDVINDVTPGNPYYVSAFDAEDFAFVHVCVLSMAPANNCVGTIMVLVDAQDSDGNCSDMGPFMLEVTINDMTPPEITCPPAVTIDCSESVDPNVNIDAGIATAIDNCSGDVTISYSDDTLSMNGCSTVIDRTWRAEDCGNSAECVQTITQTDQTPPDFTVPDDITIYVDVNCAYNADTMFTGDVLDESDDCDMSVEATFLDAVEPGLCSGSSTITRTWTAQDDCGNSNQQIQTISVLDNIPPVLTGCPVDATVECHLIPDVNTYDVNYTDNCDMTVIPVFGDEEIIPDPLNPDACVNEFLIQRTWTAIDNCNNVSSCVQVLRVVDTTAPEITCPSDVTIECDDDESSASQGMATATDNCTDPLVITIDEFDQITGVTCTNGYTITRTWTATDECDNASSCAQTILVEDTTIPTITLCPPSVVIECDQDTSAIAQGIVDAFDNCADPVSISWMNTVTAGACEHAYTIERVFTVADNCGNSTTCLQTIDVEDTTPPDPDCPADETVECDDIPVSITPDVTDNCDAGPAVLFDEVSLLDGCGNYTGTITRTWTFTDDCGNAATCVQVLQSKTTWTRPGVRPCPLMWL